MSEPRLLKRRDENFSLQGVTCGRDTGRLDPRRIQHVMGREPELLEDHRHLVDEGDVDVALGILDQERKAGALDTDVLDLFIDFKPWESAPKT